SLGNLHPLAKQYVRLTEIPHDLLRTVSLLHTESFPASQAGWILSHLLVQVSGKGSHESHAIKVRSARAATARVERGGPAKHGRKEVVARTPLSIIRKFPNG